MVAGCEKNHGIPVHGDTQFPIPVTKMTLRSALLPHKFREDDDHLTFDTAFYLCRIIFYKPDILHHRTHPRIQGGTLHIQ